MKAFISYSFKARQDMLVYNVISTISDHDFSISSSSVYATREESPDVIWLIEKALRSSSIFVYVLSKNPSKWQKFELDFALKNKLPILPVIEKGVKVPSEISHLQYLQYDLEDIESLKTQMDDVLEKYLERTMYVM